MCYFGTLEFHLRLPLTPPKKRLSKSIVPNLVSPMELSASLAKMIVTGSISSLSLSLSCHARFVLLNGCNDFISRYAEGRKLEYFWCYMVVFDARAWRLLCRRFKSGSSNERLFFFSLFAAVCRLAYGLFAWLVGQR